MTIKKLFTADFVKKENMKNYKILLLCLALSSCSLLPKESTDKATGKAAAIIESNRDKSFSQETKGIPLAAKLSFGTNQLELYPFESKTEVKEKSNIDASSIQKNDISSLVSIPLGVKLILIALGIFAVVFAFRYVRKQSAAIDAAWSAGDKILANIIHQKEEQARSSTDASTLAGLNAEISSLEKQRGKFNAN